MKPRVELALALALLVVLGVIAAAVGSGGQRGPSLDPRRSTYLTGPLGARAFGEALIRLGVPVTRFRQPTSRLATLPDSGERLLLAFLDPALSLDGAEAQDLVAYNERHDLLLAGEGAERVIRCYGYAVEERPGDSLQALPYASPRGTAPPRAHAVLALRGDTVVSDSSQMEDRSITGCEVPPVVQAETLLVSSGGRAIALRLRRGDSGTSVTLVADGSLFANRTLRDTDAGPFAIGLVLGRYDRLVIDEAHQGFTDSSSLWGAVLAWSRHSPFGWAAWQMAVVGVLALLAGAVRFGPLRTVIERKRRSPLEHVRALATALQATRGHDVAVQAIVRGLRRRLLPAGQRTRGDWRAWLDRLPEQVRSARGREAARQLRSLIQPGQPAFSVLRASNAAEVLWEELGRSR